MLQARLSFVSNVNIQLPYGTRFLVRVCFPRSLFDFTSTTHGRPFIGPEACTTLLLLLVTIIIQDSRSSRSFSKAISNRSPVAETMYTCVPVEFYLGCVLSFTKLHTM